MSDDIATTGAETTETTGDDTTNTSSVLTEESNTDATDSTTDDKSSADDTGTDDKSDSDDAGEEGSDSSLKTYADFEMPEGVQIDETLLAEAVPIFKELELSQEQAQKLVDFQAQQVQAGTQKQVDAFNQLKTDWLDQSKKDGEFGGDKFDENVKVARSAVAQYGTPELKQLLEDHGVGNHPELIRFMVRVGQTLKPDVPGAEGHSTSKAEDRVSILYPNDK